MQIYFSKIRYLNIPIIWEYDEALNRAACLFKLKESRFTVSKKRLTDLLCNLKGVVVNEDTGDIIIEDAHTFFKTYEMTVFEPPLDVPPLSPKRISINDEEGHTFFTRTIKKSSMQTTSSAPTLISTSSAVDVLSPALSSPSYSPLLIPTTRAESTLSQPTDDDGFDKEVRHGIWLNTLFPKTKQNADLTKWSNTRAYEGYFAIKTKNDESTRQAFLFSLDTNLRGLQYEKNHQLYPIKSRQMALVRALFDEKLAPIYQKINGDDPAPRQLISFFQDAIEGLILNSRFNSGPTEYEKMSDEERAELFGDDELAYENAVLEARRAHARIMLRPLRYFISDIPLKYKDGVLKTQLELLKLGVQPISAVINCLINELETLIIEAGKIEFQFTQRMQEAKNQQDKRDKIINEHYSCYHLVSTFLQSTLLSPRDEAKSKGRSRLRKESKIEDMAVEVISTTIQAIRTSPALISSPLIPSLGTRDNDFYLSKEIRKSFQYRLAAYFQKELESRKLSKTKPSKGEQIAIIKDYIVDFIGQQLEGSFHVEPTQSSLSFSSSSSESAEVKISTPRPFLHSIFTRQPSSRTLQNLTDKKIPGDSPEKPSL